MIRISPFTPLFFSPSTDSGAESRYVQTFANADRILVEVVADISDDVPTITIEDKILEKSNECTLSQWQINAEKIVYFCMIRMLTDGYYTVKINDAESELFYVTSDATQLADTTLIQYSMEDNRKRTDCVFIVNHVRQFFDFRVPGGFKDRGWSFGVEGEQFVTRDSDIVSLYARESMQKAFTMGGQMGCPIWFAEHLNRLLCCDFVYFDGVRYCRKESSVPEITESLEGSRSFVCTQILQKVVYMNGQKEENELLLRRVDTEYRTTTDNGSIVVPVKI